MFVRKLILQHAHECVIGHRPALTLGAGGAAPAVSPCPAAAVAVSIASSTAGCSSSAASASAERSPNPNSSPSSTYMGSCLSSSGVRVRKRGESLRKKSKVISSSTLDLAYPLAPAPSSDSRIFTKGVVKQAYSFSFPLSFFLFLPPCPAPAQACPTGTLKFLHGLNTTLPHPSLV